MKLIAHVIDGHHVDIRPAPVERDWMDATNQRFAYRCLPLNIANAYGWEILCNAGFLAMWWGGEGLDSIVIEPDPGTIAPAISHFGHGILTFHLPCLFSTEPGAELMVQGPINRPKDGIAALSGVIETNWSPYSFHHELDVHSARHAGPLREGRGLLSHFSSAMRRDRRHRARA
jgi:hypothetical protein